jgi:hypothetical protein
VRTNRCIVNGQCRTPDDNVIYTHNFILELGGDLELLRAIEMLDKTEISRSSDPNCASRIVASSPILAGSGLLLQVKQEPRSG